MDSLLLPAYAGGINLISSSRNVGGLTQIRNYGLVSRNGTSSLLSFSSLRRRPLHIVVAKKDSGKKKEDSHSFIPRPDEITGPFPEAVLLKEVRFVLRKLILEQNSSILKLETHVKSRVRTLGGTAVYSFFCFFRLFISFFYQEVGVGLACKLGEIAYQNCLLICGYRWACTIYLGKERILEMLIDLFFSFFFLN